MALAPQNPPGVDQAGAGKPPPGQVSGVARALAAKHGAPATGPAPRLAGLPPRPNGPGTKGGRRPFQEELSEYLASTGQAIGAAPAMADTGLAPQPAPYLVTPEFIGEVTKTLAQGIEAFRVRQVALKVRTLSGDGGLAKELGESASAPPGCIDTMEKAAGELARKYPAILQWGPEGAMLGCMAAWFAKDRATMKKLAELEDLVREQAKAKATATSVSQKTA